MSVTKQVFRATYGGIYNLPDPTYVSNAPLDKILVIGTPTNQEVTFGIDANGVQMKFVLNGNFVFNPAASIPKNLLEAQGNVTGTQSEFSTYYNNVLVARDQYIPSVPLDDPDLAFADKKVAASVYSGNDTFIGATDGTPNDDSDTVDGFAGNDVFYGNGSNKYDDFFYGGDGIDTSVFRYSFSNYSITSSNNVWNEYTRKGELKGFYIKDKVGADAQQGVSGVERLKFSDKSIALDIDGNAGTALKILAAVFGKSTVNNKQFVGIGLDLLDKGMSYDTLAGLALGVAQATTNDQIVTTLWTNVVGSVPSANDKAPFIKLLQDGLSAGALAHLAADTSLNTNNINLVGLAQTGIEYTPVV